MSVQKIVNAKIRPETINVNVTVVIPLFREVKVQNRSKTSRKKANFTYKYFFVFRTFEVISASVKMSTNVIRLEHAEILPFAKI